MAEEKLSQQPPADAGTEADFGMVVQSGVTKQQTRPQLRTAIMSGWQTFVRSFLQSATQADARSAISAIALTDTGAFAGSAAKLTTIRTITATGDGSWTVSFDGSANASAAFTLASSGVTANTYGSVTVNAKGLITSGSIATPIANGGTGATTQGAALTAILGSSAVPIANGGTGATTQGAALTALLGASAVPVANGGTGATTATAAGTNLGTATVGTSTDQLARSSMIQNEIANKRTWTSYTPTITPTTGTFTSATATGKSMVAFGICYWQATVTITTKGTGTFPLITLPVAALNGSSQMPIPAREAVVNGKAGIAIIQAGLTSVKLVDYANGDLVTADGAAIFINGSYPVA